MSVTTRFWISAGSLVLLGSLVAPPACSGDDFAGSNGGTGNKDGGAGTGGSGGSVGGSGGSVGGSGGAQPDSGTGGDASSVKQNGAACSSESQCQSGHCVDGVCCESECTGTCVSCKVTGKEGKCAPQPEGTDPDGDCQADSGAEACEQVCNGQGACVSCGQFKCGTSGCLTSCTDDTQCKDTGWCNTGSCGVKQPNGQTCGAANQCQSGFCEGSVCCNSACPSPNSCDNGTCTCNGAVCSGTDTCQIWYLDQDGDGYPASSSFDKAACTQPADVNGKHYMLGPPTDCYDQNAQAHPGQTQFFSGDRGDGSFDYDCDGSETQEYPNVGTAVCGACGTPVSGTCALSCIENPGYQCASCSGIKYAFRVNVPCGLTGTLYNCVVTGTCTLGDHTAPNTAQLCR